MLWHFKLLNEWQLSAKRVLRAFKAVWELCFVAVATRRQPEQQHTSGPGGAYLYLASKHVHLKSALVSTSSFVLHREQRHNGREKGKLHSRADEWFAFWLFWRNACVGKCMRSFMLCLRIKNICYKNCQILWVIKHSIMNPVQKITRMWSMSAEEAKEQNTLKNKLM